MLKVEEVIDGLQDEVKGYLQAIQSADNACKNDEADEGEFNYVGWRKSIQVLSDAINMLIQFKESKC